MCEQTEDTCKCSFCGIEVDLEDATCGGWEPCYYDGETQMDQVCPECSAVHLIRREDGEMELKKNEAS